MRPIQPDLHETAVENPLPGLTTHAYLLLRDGGNVLFYNTGLEGELDRMAELGGVAYQLLSHEDEVGPSLRTIRARFGAKLGGHVAEREAFAQHVAPDILFDGRQTLLEHIEVIPTPGHTPGSTCFLVASPTTGLRYLFTGDTLFRDREGGWTAGFIRGHSDGPQLVDTLGLLEALDPDLVVGSAFGGDAGFERIPSGRWPVIVASARRRLEAKLSTG
jgi:hydroxyacylglutathione hydrolase